MSNKRIDQLPPSGNDLKGTDLLAVWSDNKTERITLDSVAGYSGFTSENTFLTGGTFNDGTITLSDKSGNNISVSGISDTYVISGFYTPSASTITFTNNSGQTFNVTGVTQSSDVFWTSGSTGNYSVKQAKHLKYMAMNTYYVINTTDKDNVNFSEIVQYPDKARPNLAGTKFIIKTPVGQTSDPSFISDGSEILTLLESPDWTHSVI